jgi:hypothetical protein
MATVTIYGLGGYDPEKENNNIIEQYEVEDPQPSEQEILKQSAKNKLTALGLSEEEIQALLN